MTNDIFLKLKRLKIEDYIWIVVICIGLLNLYSNYYERRFIVTGDISFYNVFRKVNLTILVITIIITIYFTALSYDNYQKSKNKEEFLLPLISNILFLVGGLILIYAFFRSSNTNDTDVTI